MRSRHFTRVLINLTLLLILQVAAAQQTEESTPAFRNKISFQPASLFANAHPSILLGYERSLSEHWATHAHLGVMLSKDNDYARDAEGIRTGLEAKYYTGKPLKSRWFFSLALEHIYKKHSADLYYTFVPLESFGPPRRRSDYFSHRVTIEKSFISLTPRIGLQEKLTERILLEGFVGLGWRWRNVKHLNPPDTTAPHQERDYVGIDFEYISNQADRNSIWDIDANVRVIWSF